MVSWELTKIMGKKGKFKGKNTNYYLCDVKWDKGQEISKEKCLIFIYPQNMNEILFKFWAKA